MSAEAAGNRARISVQADDDESNSSAIARTCRGESSWFGSLIDHRCSPLVPSKSAIALTSLFLSSLHAANTSGSDIESLLKAGIAVDIARSCGFRRNWSTDSGVKWSAIPVGSGPEFRKEVVQFLELTGTVDHLPECWTT